MFAILKKMFQITILSIFSLGGLCTLKLNWLLKISEIKPPLYSMYLHSELHTASLGGQGGLSYFLCYVMYLSILHTTKIQDKFENEIRKFQVYSYRILFKRFFGEISWRECFERFLREISSRDFF